MQQQNLGPKQLRSFGLLVGGIFAVIGLWPVVFRGEDPRIWALTATGLLGIPALTVPGLLKPIYRVWMFIGHILGWVNTRIILGLLYYIMFTPVGLIMRLFGSDPMRRKPEAEAETYRVMREPRSASHMKHQF